MPRPAGDDDDVITLRLSRRVVASALALVQALALHAVVFAIVALLPEPPRREERIEFSVRAQPPPSSSSPPSSPSSSSPSPPRVAARAPPPRRAAQPSPPPTSPVVPELPASPSPPDNAAILPVVDKAPDPVAPAPPASPTPSTWKDHLLSSLKSPPRPNDGFLAPSTSTLAQVANADARLHDDENERRLVEDYGPFFRRGLEALRATWHPDDVLRRDRSDEVRRCARQTRETLAIAVIDRDGHVVDVQLSRASGCPALDGEALAAFRRVARFPYPPEGLFVDGAGAPAATARLPVRFIVSFDGSVRLDWR
jgi:TonB family protein